VWSHVFGSLALRNSLTGAGTPAHAAHSRKCSCGDPCIVILPGQLFDGQAGLHQNGFRDYGPAIGRYPTSDPSGLVAGVNTYAYVRDNPISFIDRLGLTAEDVNVINQYIQQNFPDIQRSGG
jgi:RHS repeat-associated protein